MEGIPSRRKALKSIGAGFVTVGTIPTIGQADDFVEAVMEWHGDEPFVTRQVPRSWFEHTKSVHEVEQELTNKYKNNPDIYDFRIVQGSETRGGKNVTQIEAVVQKGTKVRNSVPDSKGNVDIKVKEVAGRDVKLLSHEGCENNGEYDTMPGGVLIMTEVDDNHSDDGTVTCPVKRNGDDYALTANHLFLHEIDECLANWGKDAWQHINLSSQYIGNVDKYNQEHDYAILKMENMEPKYTVKKSYWTGDIVSHVSETRLAELVSSDDTWVEKMGMKTGGTFGQIESKSESVSNGCLDFDSNGVQCSAEVGGGDSGGPMYLPSESSDGISIVGLVTGTRNWVSSGEACDGSDTYESFFGPPAWHMADHFDLTFGK